jgi:hypothetical protein
LQSRYTAKRHCKAARWQRERGTSLLKLQRTNSRKFFKLWKRQQPKNPIDAATWLRHFTGLQRQRTFQPSSRRSNSAPTSAAAQQAAPGTASHSQPAAPDTKLDADITSCDVAMGLGKLSPSSASLYRAYLYLCYTRYVCFRLLPASTRLPSHAPRTLPGIRKATKYAHALVPLPCTACAMLRPRRLCLGLPSLAPTLALHLPLPDYGALLPPPHWRPCLLPFCTPTFPPCLLPYWLPVAARPFLSFFCLPLVCAPAYSPTVSPSSISSGVCSISD